MKKTIAVLYCAVALPWFFSVSAQNAEPAKASSVIDTSGFVDSANHWYNITEEDKAFEPVQNQKRYRPEEVAKIADNILLYQRSNGGWPKNYDMQAVLTPEQRAIVEQSRLVLNTTIDNRTTHSQIEYLARAYAVVPDERYKAGCERGIDYLLSAQYPNGGWPQFFPDTSGYRKHITFNDDAMIGVMKVLRAIVTGEQRYAFLDARRRQACAESFQRGIGCILRCQVREGGQLKVWGQQHDHVTFQPQWARAFEPPCLTSAESAEIVKFLMSLDKPPVPVVKAVQGAVRWFESVKLKGIRIDQVPFPKTTYKYRTVDFDKVVVKDSAAPPLWTRYYELVTGRPMFCNRDSGIVYSLAEVAHERRAGYKWYNDDPADVLKAYPAWVQKWGVK